MRPYGMRVAAIGAVSLGLAGCFWPAPGAGPGRTAHNIFETELTVATVADLGLVWTATGDLGAMGPPVTSLRGVHASDTRGTYAFSFDTGARLWSQPLPETPTTMGTVVADGDRVVLGNGFGNLGGNWTTSFHDAATGAEIPVGGIVGAGMVDGLDGNHLLVRNFGFGSGTPVVTRVAVSDLTTGTGWSAAIDIAGQGGVTGPLTLGTERVYQAGRGLIPPNSSGTAVRAYPVATAPPQCPSPAPAGFGCPIWLTPISGTTATSPVIDGPDEAVIYTGTDTGSVYALDTATGAILWTSTAAAPAQVTDPPALADGHLYVPTTDGLLVLDAATGATEWTARTGSLQVQPAVAGGVVFTGGEDGELTAFDAAGCGHPRCHPLWSADTGGSPISGGPAVNQGRLYAGIGDGRLVAYGLG